MKAMFNYLAIIFIWHLCLPPYAWPLSSSDINDEITARDHDFFQKALAGTLDCTKEILQKERNFNDEGRQHSKVYDVHYWRTFGSHQCFRALLKAKAFDTALRFIETSKREYLNEWWALALEESFEVPVYATDGKCKSGEEQYSGDAQARLIVALLKGRNLGIHPPGRRGDMEGVLVRMSSYEAYPACMERQVVIDWLNKFIDLGLETKFWWEEPMVVGGLTTLSGIMRLGDVDLVKRILTNGSGQSRKYVVYLYARAPSVEMVKTLEQYFKLKKTEYKTVLQIIESEKKFPENIRKFGAGVAPPEVLAFIKQRAQ